MHMDPPQPDPELNDPQINFGSGSERIRNKFRQNKKTEKILFLLPINRLNKVKKKSK